ncbi:MAG: ABC transporter substrate-binding protein [Ruminococcus sp.]
MRNKKTAVAALAGLMLISAVSCGSKRNSGKTDDFADKNDNVITIVQTNASELYKKSELPYPEYIDRVINFIFDDVTEKIYIFGTDSSGELRCCMTDNDFSTYKPVILKTDYNSIQNPEDSIVITIADEKIFAVTAHVDYGDTVMTDDMDYNEYMQSAEYSYKLSVFSLSGELISSNMISGEEYISDRNSFASVRSAVYAGDNRLIVMFEQRCMLIDADGNILSEINAQNGNAVSDIVQFSDGKIICRTDEKGKALLHDIDLNTMKSGDYKAVFSENNSGTFLKGTEEYLAYITDSTCLYGLKSDNTIEKIIDFLSSGLTGLRSLTPISGGDFICCDGDGKIIRLTERDEAEYTQIQDITLAVSGKYDSIQEIIAEFNSQSNKYRINIKNYSENYEYSIEGLGSAVKDLEMDLISGSIPDIVYLDSNEIQKLSSKEIFSDLYDFIDNDKDYSREDFLPNVLEACETNGHLFSFAPSFQIRTIAAKTKFAATKNWTFSEFRNIYDSLPAEIELFEMGNNKEAVLHYLTNGGADFVDYGNHTCSFNSPEFIQLLEFADTFPGVDMYNFELKSCRNDTALLSPLYIETFRDFNVKKQSIFGDDITFVGAPSNDGNGSVIILSEQFAIMESSDFKEGAWEFLKFIFNPDNTDPQMSGIPVTEKGFRTITEAALERPYYIDRESGNQKVYWDEYGYDPCTGAEINITPMNETDKKFYEEFVRSLTVSSSGISDDQIINIVNEETVSYFEGECSAQQCAEMIQNRVSIMLSEQR